MPGTLDPQSGTYIYASDDARSPMNTVLNLLANSTRDAIRAAKDRILDLETRFATLDTSTARTPILVNTTNYELTNLANIWGDDVPGLAVRRIGQQIITDGAVNAKALTGGPGPLVIGDVPPAFRPAVPVPFQYFRDDGGDVYRGIIRTNGNIRIVLAPTAVGQDLTFVVPPYFTA